MLITGLTINDAELVRALYVETAAGGTLSKDPDEYGAAAVNEMLEMAVSRGFCLGAFDKDVLCGEIHAVRLQARRFQHVFSGLTAAVHPKYQGRGLGRQLFKSLLAKIDALDPPVTRIELILQAGNAAALHLYLSLGFAEEGRLRRRVCVGEDKYADDIYMGRIRNLG